MEAKWRPYGDGVHHGPGAPRDCACNNPYPDREWLESWVATPRLDSPKRIIPFDEADNGKSATALEGLQQAQGKCQSIEQPSTAAGSLEQPDIPFIEIKSEYFGVPTLNNSASLFVLTNLLFFFF